MVQSSSKEYALKRPYVILCEVLSQLRHLHIVNYKRLYHKVLTHNYKKLYHKVCKAEEIYQKADERIGKTYKSFESFQKTKIFHQVLKSRN